VADRQLTLPLGPVRNSNLFSNHWLENRLPLEPEWRDLHDEAVALLNRLGGLWLQERNRVEEYREAALEEAFIQPILKALGWTLNNKPGLQGQTPDLRPVEIHQRGAERIGSVRGGRKTRDCPKFPTAAKPGNKKCPLFRSLQQVTTPFHSGWFAYSKAYIAQIPIKLPTTAEEKKLAERITQSVRVIMEAKAALRAGRLSDGETTRLQAAIEAHEKRIDEAVFALYGVAGLPGDAANEP